MQPKKHNCILKKHNIKRENLKYRKWVVSDIANAVKESITFKQAFKKLGAANSGGSYQRIRNIIRAECIDTSHFKLGGANLTGKEYFSAPGIGAIGSQFFISWTINN